MRTARSRRGPHDLADAVDVALDDVAAEAVLHPHRALEVDRIAGDRRPSVVRDRVSSVTSALPPARPCR
jgi:hypothetical protein